MFLHHPLSLAPVGRLPTTGVLAKGFGHSLLARPVVSYCIETLKTRGISAVQASQARARCLAHCLHVQFPIAEGPKCYDEIKKSAGLMPWSRQPSGQKPHTRKRPPSRTTQDSPCCFWFTMCECEKVAAAAAAIFAAAAILGFRMPRGAEGPSAVMLCRSWIAARNSGW